VYSTTVGQSTLDEAPGAYKGMEEIVANIKNKNWRLIHSI